MPYLTIEWVCPPQTSMSTHGRVTMRRISSTILPASASLRYSSRNFMAHFRLLSADTGADFGACPAHPSCFISSKS